MRTTVPGGAREEDQHQRELCRSPDTGAARSGNPPRWSTPTAWSPRPTATKTSGAVRPLLSNRAERVPQSTTAAGTSATAPASSIDLPTTASQQSAEGCSRTTWMWTAASSKIPRQLTWARITGADRAGSDKSVRCVTGQAAGARPKWGRRSADDRPPPRRMTRVGGGRFGAAPVHHQRAAGVERAAGRSVEPRAGQLSGRG